MRSSGELRGVQDKSGDIATLSLRFLRSESALAAGQPLPGRIQILKWGVNQSTEGPVLLDERSLAVFNANQIKIGRQRVALDFEHNTVPGTEEYKRTTEPRTVAAFGAPELIAGQGLFLTALSWTPDGKKSAFNFEDLSATPVLDAEGRVIALHSAALTRAGAVYDLPTFLDQAELASLSATLTKNIKPMSDKIVMTLAALAACIGLPETATEAEVTAKLKDRLAPVALPDLKPLSSALETFEARLKTIETANTKQIATLSATLDGKTVTLSAEDLVNLHNRVETLSAQLKASADTADEAERNRVLDEAAREGKVIPLSAATVKTLSTTALKELVAGLPKDIVPLHARGKKPAEAQGRSALKGLEKAIAAHAAGE